MLIAMKGETKTRKKRVVGFKSSPLPPPRAIEIRSLIKCLDVEIQIRDGVSQQV
jgi:hypothetical protein